MPRILYIVPADYDALKAKGVDKMIFERDEHGFFERVVTVHPIAYKNRSIFFNDVFALHEYDPDLLSGLSRSRWLRALLSPVHFIRVVTAVVNLIRRERIDLIRANDPYWIGLIGLTAARLTGRPLCVSIHSDYDKRQELTGGGDTFTFFGVRWPARMACRAVLSGAGMVLPIRESLVKWAVDNGAARERVKVIPHGIDIKSLESVERCDIRALFDIPAGRQILSFVGRFSPENYIADIMELTRRLTARRSDFCVVIAGGGELEEWIKGLCAADPRIASSVRLVGFRPRSVCFSLRRQSAVSLCLMGGFSLIEACLAGCAVVSYDVEWHKELIQDGITGALIKEHDVDGLEKAVNFLLDHPGDARAMGRKASVSAADKHDIKNTSKIKQGCYEKLLSGGRFTKKESGIAA